jgi:hypothetical protein
MMKTLCLALAMGMISLCGCAGTGGNDEGYFLSLSQKGQLIGKGEIEDGNGVLYNVYIVPGYKYPVTYGWRNLKEAGGNFAEYGRSEKYTDLWDASSSCFEWAFEDCLYDFAFVGTGEAWSDNFSEAGDRVSRRVFGWWMAYPWALFQSTIETGFRIPVGVTGTALGTVAGGAIVPAYYITNSTFAGTWNGGAQGLVFPTTGLAWNTITSPPMALVGQKPSESRVDGFWVSIIEPEMGEQDIAPLARWGSILHRELAPYRTQRKAVDKELAEKLKPLRKEMERLRIAAQDQTKRLDKEEETRFQKLLAAPEHAADLEAIRQGRWNQARLYENRVELFRLLMENEDIPEENHSAIMELLQHHPLSQTTPRGHRTRRKKTDPAQETVEIIKNIE